MNASSHIQVQRIIVSTGLETSCSSVVNRPNISRQTPVTLVKTLVILSANIANNQLITCCSTGCIVAELAYYNVISYLTLLEQLKSVPDLAN